MTNEQIEQYPFKQYKLSLHLREASALLSSLVRSEDDQVRTASPNWEMKSQAQAEARGITRWVNYNSKLSCNKPKHYARDTFIKTPLGWMQICCSKELGLERLPNAYNEPTEQEIKAIYSDKKNELSLILEYRQRIATAKGVATRKLQAEKMAGEKALQRATKVAKKAAMTPQEILDKKVARAERAAEKRLTLSLLATISG